MKHFRLKIILALLILAAAFAPLSALAAPNPPAASVSTGPTTAQTAQAQTAAAGSNTPNYSWYDYLNPLTWIDSAMELIVLPYASLILAIAGGFLDFSINFSLHTADLVNQSGGAIVLGWTIIRDIFNMLFIFVLIYSAISIMLNSSSWNGKQVLTKVIIAAILINFSFFITEVIIDAGNLIGGWFYQGIQTTIGANGSISASISAALGVWTSQTSNATTGLISTALIGPFGTPTSNVLAAFIRFGIIVFASYIFIYVSILFLARAVSLLFSLVMSPLGFAGGILPQTKKYADKWKDELIKDILLAPVFLLFLYVIIAFVNSPIFTATGSISANFLLNPTDALQQSLGAFFKYFLLAGMLLYAVKAAKDQSSALGSALEGMAKQLAQAAAGVAVGVATGGTSLALRTTIGAAGSMVANSDTVKGMVGSNNRVTSALGSSLRTTGTWTSKQNFDASKTVSKSFGVNIPKSLQAETGKGKSGYAGLQKRREDEAKETAMFIGPSDIQEGAMKVANDAANASVTVEYGSERQRLENRRNATKATYGEDHQFYKDDVAALEALSAKEKAMKEDILAEKRNADPSLDAAFKAQERLNTYTGEIEKGNRGGLNPNSIAGLKNPFGATAKAAGLASTVFEAVGMDWAKNFSKGVSEGLRKGTATDENLAKTVRKVSELRKEKANKKRLVDLAEAADEARGGDNKKGEDKPKPEKPEGEAK